MITDYAKTWNNKHMLIYSLIKNYVSLGRPRSLETQAASTFLFMQRRAMYSGTNVNLQFAPRRGCLRRSGVAALASLRDENTSTPRGAGATGAEVSRVGAGHVGERNDWGKFFSASSALHMLWEWEPGVNLAPHFKTLWSRRARCILIQAVSWFVISDSQNLSVAVPRLYSKVLGSPIWDITRLRLKE